MKKRLLMLSLLLVGQQAIALDSQDQQNYVKHYSEQMLPLVLKKLSSDRPEMTAKALRSEAENYVKKMANCQLEGLGLFPENYREKAILPVAQGQDIMATTQALNSLMKKDIEEGRLSKDKAAAWIQGAQQTVQICVNS
ncbi:MAG TPA: hypothetical protein ENI26_06645 [Methylophaga aminisulfidivorans]|uniref:Uncharacterized protein n=2 Tax=root TaxID=1 RepID=A0A7C1W749_9GAMM|nr:hypothetical protein [Methylophaga aminisulfidivorans]